MPKKPIRDNPRAIAACLTEIFKKNDIPGILDALHFILQAQNVKALAEYAGMRRDSLYRTFDGRTDPQLSRILKLFKGLGVHVVVKPLPVKYRPPRSALGRALSSSRRR
jgi:probable addiction module antidote protein